MSSAEFVEWLAYQRLAGPLGPERDDWRMAMIASTIANVMRDPKKSREVTPQQFIPDWPAIGGVSEELRAKSPEEVAAVGEAWFDRLRARAQRAVRR